MDSLSEFLQFCIRDKDFKTFLDAFNEYVEGDCGVADVMSENFLINGTIPNCTPSGKYMTNGFLQGLLKLNIGVAYSKGLNVRGVSIGGIDCNSFVGLKNKTPRFRASSEFVCTVFNYILAHSTLKWTGLDCGECLVPDKSFSHTAKKMHDDIQAVMKNRKIDKGRKADFLKSNFDVSGYTSFLQMKAKIEDGINVVSQDQTSDVTIEGCQPKRETREKRKSEKIVAIRVKRKRSESQPKHEEPLSKKRSNLRKTQKLSNLPRPRTPHKIPVWRSTYNSKINQIKKLKKENCDLKLQVCNANTKFVDNAVAAVREEYIEKMSNLQETVNEYELELEKRGEAINNWKQKYQNLKDDYESEAFKHGEEVSILREELDSKETSESVEQLGNIFDAEEVPQIKIRAGLKNINPHVLKILCILRIVVGLSLRKCVMCLVLVGNHMFGQNWTLPKSKEYKKNARANRCMPAPLTPNIDDSALNSKLYGNITDFTAPAPSYLKQIIEKIIEPNSLGSIFAELKDPNTQYATLSADHYAEHRQKHQTQNLMTSRIDPSSGKAVVGYRCLGLTNVFKTTGEATFEQIKQFFLCGAIFSAKTGDAEDILTSLIDILKPVKFSVTDGASSMRIAMEMFSNWRTEMTKITGDFVWIHCNAHVLPALTIATEKALKAVERMLQLKMYACQEFNKFFFKVSDSVVETIFTAIFRIVGPSAKNQEYACTIQFHAYLNSLNEPLNRFFDPQSSRFGKETEMGMIIAYNFKILRNFFQTTYMPNNLFKACELYMSCPMLYEITIAMACTYYHLLGPFKIACGADKLEGYENRRLPHKKLLKFYKAFVKTLEELAADPTPLLKISILPNLAEFNLSLFTKGHLGIISFVVEELETNEDINLDVVKSVLKLTCEEYFIAINRQVDEFYIKDGSIIENILAVDENALDNVPTTSLASERSVALARASFKVAPNASTRTHSNFQMINTAPFFSQFAKMSAEQISEMILKTKKSDLNGILKRFNQRRSDLEKQALQGTVNELVKKRDEHAQSRIAICEAVKSHGGPLQSPEEVEQFCSNYQGSTEQLGKVIAAELKFQKIIINNRAVNADLFKCREKDKSTGDGKFRAFSVSERIANLKEVVSPLPEEIKFPEINTAEFVKKVDEHHSTLKSYPHRKKKAVEITSMHNEQLPVPPPHNDPVQFSDAITYISVFFDGEERLWYPGIVTKFIDSKSCGSCKTLEGIEGSHSRCCMSKFMTPIGPDIFELLDGTEYHVHPSQLILTPTIEYVQLDNGGLGYKILNFLDVDESVKNNPLYICLQGAVPSADKPQPKRKPRKSKAKKNN